MVDYSSWKVTELKKELKERGLPVGGLKKDLVERLQSAEEASQTEAISPDNNVAGDSPPRSQTVTETGAAGAEPQESHVTTTAGESSEETPNQDGDAPAQHASAIEHAEPATGDQTADAASKVDEAIPQDKSDPKEAPQDAPLPHVDTIGVSQAAAVDVSLESQTPGPILESNGSTKADTDAAGEMPPVMTQEARADASQRRKRSRTPAPDEREIAKKLKSLDGPVETKRVADASSEQLQDGRITEEARQPTDGPSIGPEIIETEHLKTREGLGEAKSDGNSSQRPAGYPKDTSLQSTTEPTALIDGPANVDNNHVVPPAVHPATMALYVKNLKRPIHPNQLQNHLTKLAKSYANGTETKLTAFFLDSIRTHCFVRFESVSIATQVREELHNRVWPEERGREPLWVDYVPEDAVNEWIEIEQAEGGRRGSGGSQKRWEVVYRDSAEGVIAKLQPDDHHQPLPLAKQPTRSSKENIYALEEIQRQRRQESSRNAATFGRGFKTLDDLFDSTKAKPKLYFKPVSTELAHSRLDRLANARGGGKADGMAKYSFEHGNILIDNGPDRGLRLDMRREFVGHSARLARVSYGRT